MVKTWKVQGEVGGCPVYFTIQASSRDEALIKIRQEEQRWEKKGKTARLKLSG